uniref:Uncharacterized protein n=1 Tax=Rhizophora mucronata TaxID=61149 RepID=A0A2P2PA51_RHIMU
MNIKGKITLLCQCKSNHKAHK